MATSSNLLLTAIKQIACPESKPPLKSLLTNATYRRAEDIVRRLAKQDREDEYASRRDYQEVHATASMRLRAENGLKAITWSAETTPSNQKSLFAVGGFIRIPGNAEILLAVTAVNGGVERHYHAGEAWLRIGVGLDFSEHVQVKISITLSEPQPYVDVWGLTAAVTEFPVSDGAIRPSVEELNEVHLIPETLYLNHSHDLPPSLTGFSEVAEGSGIDLKKCSYCGRLLPIGPGAAGGLSFHKHNAKISGHQNECRSCKKWRINNTFNPLRTPDQHNESSVITRERRLLLRENEILQRIKEREGRGLKSIVWDRFDRRCFYCQKPLELQQVELDHTRPLAYLWPIDEHATCLCSEHNNHKKDRFPVDFYTDAQLVRLAEITGLSLEGLSTRSVCAPELARIRNDIAGFASKADPRAFNAIARKVLELRPDVDLWAELKSADPDVHARVWGNSQLRPGQVEVLDDVDQLLDTLEE